MNHVVICGHYYCGGVQAAMQPSDLGILNPWLRNIRDVYRMYKPELVATALQTSQMNKLIKDVQKKIGELLAKHTDKPVYDDLIGIDKTLKHQILRQDNWQVFTNMFQEVHPDFFKALKNKAPKFK